VYTHRVFLDSFTDLGGHASSVYARVEQETSTSRLGRDRDRVSALLSVFAGVGLVLREIPFGSVA
jgi:hypothetical protein